MDEIEQSIYAIKFFLQICLVHTHCYGIVQHEFMALCTLWQYVQKDQGLDFQIACAFTVYFMVVRQGTVT